MNKSCNVGHDGFISKFNLPYSAVTNDSIHKIKTKVFERVIGIVFVGPP